MPVAAQEYIANADKWVVPEINQGGISSATNREFYNSGALGEEDHANIARTFRIYHRIIGRRGGSNTH